MFRGNHQHIVDDKGRVAIPARFREALSGLQDERLVVTKFKRRGRPCLDVYPHSGWVRLIDRVGAKRRFGPRVAAFESWYVGAAQDVQVDQQGRVLLPPGLRAYARLERQVVLAGVTDKFRIWNKELFHQVDGEDEREVFEDPNFLDELEL
jgi:MraZ protein